MLESIGTDMEVFAKDTSNKHRSIIGLIGGTKRKPLQIKGLPLGFCLQEDNVALEFNIPPATTQQEFTASIGHMSKVVDRRLAEYGFLKSAEASVLFEEDELVHPNALVFGCEPDYNAYTRQENTPPKGVDERLRTAGGHIHVGTETDIALAVMNMDLLLGVPSVLLDDKESSQRRRQLYGTAGSLRPKTYGFEYRTLSNFWMFSTQLINWVYEQVELAVSDPIKLTKRDQRLIRNTINRGDRDAAKDIIRDFSIRTPL